MTHEDLLWSPWWVQKYFNSHVIAAGIFNFNLKILHFQIYLITNLKTYNQLNRLLCSIYRILKIDATVLNISTTKNILIKLYEVSNKSMFFYQWILNSPLSLSNTISIFLFAWRDFPDRGISVKNQITIKVRIESVFIFSFKPDSIFSSLGFYPHFSFNLF